MATVSDGRVPIEFYDRALNQIDQTLAFIPDGPLARKGFETSSALSNEITEWVDSLTPEQLADDATVERLKARVKLLGATFIMTSTTLGAERDVRG